MSRGPRSQEGQGHWAGSVVPSPPLSWTFLPLPHPSPRFSRLPQGSSPLPHSLCLALG